MREKEQKTSKGSFLQQINNPLCQDWRQRIELLFKNKSQKGLNSTCKIMNKILHYKKNLLKEKCIRFFSLVMGLIILTSSLYGVPKHSELELNFVQNKISINLKNKSLSIILSEIEKQGKIGFIVKELDEITDLNNLSLSMNNATVKDCIEELLKNTNYTYTITSNTITITKKSQNTPQTREVETEKIIGKVISKSTKAAISGATILVTGTTNGAITDEKGNFTLTVKIGSEIDVSYVGMIQVKRVIKQGEKNITIEMIEDALAVEDVIVTGFFTRSKESFTGSVKTMTSADLKRVSNTNLVGAISMLTPGLNIKVNNEMGSNPNAIPEMILRGTSSLATDADTQPNQPIIMLDGVEISMRELYDLDINEIERVNVLKDASATSLYGEKAANGVIVIERKAIDSGSIRLSYNFNANVTIPDLRSYDYLNAKEKLDFEVMANIYNFEDKYDLELYNKKMLLASQGLDTDWMSKPVRTGRTINNSVNVSGRSNNIQYRINANINNTKGVMKDDNRTSKSVGTFIMYRVENKFQASFQSNYSQIDNKDTPYGSFLEYVQMNPYDSPYDEFGNVKGRLSWDTKNPLYEAQVGNFSKSKNSTFTNTLDLRWDVMKGLYVTAQGSISSLTGSSEKYISPTSTTSTGEIKDKGSLTDGRSNNSNYSGKFVINYNTELGKDNTLSLHAGGDIYRDNGYGSTYKTIGYVNNELFYPYFSSGYPTDTKPSGNNDLSARIGAFANANFSFKNRYFVDASFRNSGSSQFGSNNRFAPFWSAGAGWNIHKESFMDESIFSVLRLRYSYGVQGSVAFSSYQAVTTYRFTNDYYYLHGIGAIPITMGNPDLTWQKTKQHNLGLSLTMFNNRIDIALDYYSRLTDDMLVDITIPPSVGVSSVKNNLGRMRNSGIEFDISASLIQTENWRLRLVLNGAHNRNKILAISNGLKKYNDDNKEASSATAAPKVLFEEGKSSTAIYAVRSLGINPANGKEVFLTKDGRFTETYDANDKIVIGDSTPKLEGAIMPSLSYRNFSLNISMTYHLGGQIYNSTRANNVENVNPKNNVDRRAYELRWKGANDLAPYLDIANANERSGIHTSRFVEDDNVLEINRIELAYEFSSKLMSKIGFKRLRLGMGMNDVVRFSTVKYERGTAYPFNRGFSFSFSPTF